MPNASWLNCSRRPSSRMGSREGAPGLGPVGEDRDSASGGGAASGARMPMGTGPCSVMHCVSQSNVLNTRKNVASTC